MSTLLSRILDAASRSYNVRATFRALLGEEDRSRLSADPGVRYGPQPYAEAAPPASERPVMFVTARFRTGSTFLWRVLNHYQGVTCYYEPFNERRWFDPAEQSAGVDPSHRGVSSYADQYAGLGELGRYHTEAWTTRRLWMDERSTDLDMERYVSLLIDKAPGYPVLQFNRADFRLRWLRARFPGCRIVHLVRNPRDQWVSSLFKQTVPRETAIGDFARYDLFYLLPWADDLKTVFPCLDLPKDMPAYALFYLLWRLSQLHGEQNADLSLKYEDLVGDLETSMAKVTGLMSLPDGAAESTDLAGLVENPSLGTWTRFAPAEWFDAVEGDVEAHLCRALPSGTA